MREAETALREEPGPRSPTEGVRCGKQKEEKVGERSH